jgi:hypothetical protein
LISSSIGGSIRHGSVSLESCLEKSSGLVSE